MSVVALPAQSRRRARHVAESVAILVSAVLATAPAAFACPNCFGSSESNVYDMYQYSTVWLSLLPFLIVGTIAATIRHYARAARDPDDGTGHRRTALGAGPRVIPLHGRAPGA